MGRMPTISTEEQRALGRKFADIIEPLPRDERLLLIIACLYGEGTAQGLSASQIVEHVGRIVRVHEHGINPAALILTRVTCPACGGVL